MSTENLVSIQIQPEDLQEIKEAIEVLNSKLKPHLISLTSLQRRKIPKMGDGSEPFVEKVMDYVQSNPEFVPPFLDLPELEVDYNAVKDLTGIYRSIQQLTLHLDDSIMLSGSEAYRAALAYYNSVKAAAKINMPNAQPIYEDLSQRFTRSKRSEEDNPSFEELWSSS